ncbi:MAG TPA: tetratricopeptide repeat protein [Polyangiaceae bacterium]
MNYRTFLFALLVLGCAGSAPPPAEEPSLEDPAPASSGAAVPASNADVEQGMAALEKQDFAGAKAILEQARKKDPKDAQAAFYLGVALEGVEDKAGAEREYRAALDLDPKLPDPAVNLSQLLLDSGNAAGALTVVDAGLKASPKHPDLLLNRAVALEGGGKKDEALAAYGAAASARPKDYVLHAAYGGLLSESGKSKEAVAELSLAMGSDDPALLASVASVLTKESAFGDCVKAVDKAMAAKKVPALFVRRGICKAGQNDEKGATADYEAALAMDAKFAPAHHYYGLLLAKKDKKKALEHLDQAVALSGDKGIGPEAKQKAAELRGKK